MNSSPEPTGVLLTNAIMDCKLKRINEKTIMHYQGDVCHDEHRLSSYEDNDITRLTARVHAALQLERVGTIATIRDATGRVVEIHRKATCPG